MATSTGTSSIVSGSTHNGDGPTEELPVMWKGLYRCKETVAEQYSNRVSSPTLEHMATEIDWSPLFPALKLKRVKFNQNLIRTETTDFENAVIQADVNEGEDEAMSELSQPLIPLRNSAKQVPDCSYKAYPEQKQCYRSDKTREITEEKLVEASQSLLPQTAAERSKLPGSRQRNATVTVTSAPSQDHRNTSITSWDAEDRISRVVTVNPEEKIPESQSTSSSKGDYPVGASQRELSQSQGSSAAADKISARLERLVGALSTSTSKQKRVMEITVNQCISKLQDNINHRLKNTNINPLQQDTMRAVLKTTQSCLTRLLQHHKTERQHLQASQTSRGRAHSQKRPGKTPILQSTHVELQQRQKELQNLMKRQQNLLDRFKEMLRIQPDTQASSAGERSHEKKSTNQRNEKVDEEIKEQSSTQADCNASTHEAQPAFQLTSQDQANNLTASGSSTLSKSRSTDNITISDKNPGNSQLLNDRVMGYTENIDEIPEASQALTTIPSVHCNRVVSAYEIHRHLRLYCNELTIPDTQELYSQPADRKANQSLDLDDSLQVEDNADAEGCPEIATVSHTDFVQEKAVSRRSRNIKRNLPWSPDQDVSQNKTKNKKSDKPDTTSDDPIVLHHSETLWLSMLHQNKDTTSDLPLKSFIENKKSVAQKSTVVKEQTISKTSQMAHEKDFGSSSPATYQYYDNANQTNLTKIANTTAESSDVRKMNIDAIPETIPLPSKQCRTIHEASGHVKDISNNLPDEPFLKPPGFTSPPQRHDFDDVSVNVSPTATSMSSDVFLVKAKELNRRMKIKEKLAAKYGQGHQAANEFSAGFNTKTTEQHQYMNPLDVRRDTVTEAIDSVIAKSRSMVEIAGKRDDLIEHTGDNLRNAAGEVRPVIVDLTAGNSSKEMTVQDKQDLTERHDNVIAARVPDKVTGKGGGLPSLKELLHSGMISPGKNSLSVMAQGIQHKATLTSLGKIRTSQGMVFTSPMQWLSTLLDGEPKKKRSSYAQIMYKGRSLLDICLHQKSTTQGFNCSTTSSGSQFLSTEKTPASGDKSFKIRNMKPVLDCVPVSKSEKAVQADLENSLRTSLGSGPQETKMSAAEVWLNKLLSTSVVRLLTEQDLVPCDDLPENFWTEDYSKVKLSVDVWNTVDQW